MTNQINTDHYLAEAQDRAKLIASGLHPIEDSGITFFLPVRPQRTKDIAMQMSEDYDRRELAADRQSSFERLSETLFLTH